MTLNNHRFVDPAVVYDPMVYVQNCIVFTDLEEALNAQLPDHQIAILFNADITEGTLLEREQESKRLMLEWLNGAEKMYRHQRECPFNIAWKSPINMANIDKLYDRNIGLVSVRYPHQMIMCDIYNTTNRVPIDEIRGMGIFVKAMVQVDAQGKFEPLDDHYWVTLFHLLGQLRQEIVSRQLVLITPNDVEVSYRTPSEIQVRVGKQRMVIERTARLVRVHMFAPLVESLVNIFGAQIRSYHKLEFNAESK